MIRNWDLREFRLEVNFSPVIPAVPVLIRRIITQKIVLLNPIMQVVPLNSHIHS